MNVYLLTAGDGSDIYAGSIEFVPNTSLGSISDPIIFMDNSISPENIGCTDIEALNYNAAALLDDSSCQYPISGCIDSEAINYNIFAVIDNGSCQYDWEEAYVSQNNQLIGMSSSMDSLADSLLEVNSIIVNLESLIESMDNSDNSTSLLLIDSLEQVIVGLQNSTDNVQLNLVDYFVDFPLGWSLFGYSCVDPQNVEDAFTAVSDKVIIIKDEIGSSYLPEYNFNGIGNLIYTEGYQIKTSERILEFQFCQTLISDN